MVLALNADEFARLSACLDVGGPMFLSFNAASWPAFGLVSWVAVGDVDETPYGHDDEGDQTWTVAFPLTPVDRPLWVQTTGGRIEDLSGTIGSLSGTIADLGR